MDELNMDCQDVEKFYQKTLKDLFYEKIKTADVAGDSGNLYMGRRYKQVIFREDMQDLYNSILNWHKDKLKEYQESLFKSGMVVMKDGKVVKLEDFFIKENQNE